jgi:hypothetical protein
VVKAMRYYSDGSGIDSLWCHWIFQWHISFRPYRGHGVISAPSENEYQEISIGVKAAGEWGWPSHHLHVPNVMEIWKPQFAGPLWAIPGLLRVTFTFTFTSLLRNLNRSSQERSLTPCGTACHERIHYTGWGISPVPPFVNRKAWGIDG